MTNKMKAREFVKQTVKKTASTRKAQVVDLFNSARGHLIMGQALYLAVKAIEARPKIQQEPSNVADMKLIMEELFPLGAVAEMAKEEHHAKTKAREHCD